MKKIFLFALSSAVSIGTLAEGRISSDLSKVAKSGSVSRVSTAESQIKTDLAGVLQTGVNNSAALQFELQSGHYILGVEGAGDEKQSLFIEKSVNNENTFLALLVNNDLFRNNWGQGQILVGKPIKNGSALMFSPMVKDEFGNLVSLAEGSRTAPVLEISLKRDSSPSRYPYMVQGHNNATNGLLMGMRGGTTKVSMLSRPTKNLFNWMSGSDSNPDSKIVISGSDNALDVAIFRKGFGDSRYQLVGLNGDLSSFSAMVSSQFDTLAESSMTGLKVERIASFMRVSGLEEEVMIIGRPIQGSHDFALTVYSPRKVGFFERLFHGNLNPTKGGFFSGNNPF